MPKVSVIIPVYGVEKYIERCARSLFEQTLDDIEYIFVDDCTPDKSIEILKSIIEEYRLRFAEEKKVVRIVRMPTNSGLPAVRRHGIQLATGEYIVHCDSDDWVDVDAYRLLYENAISHNADIVACDYYKTNGYISKAISNHYKCNPEEFLKDLITIRNTWSLWNKLVRRNIYTDNPIIYPLDIMGEDMALVFQLAYYSKKIAVIERPLYFYFQNTESITHIIDKNFAYKRFRQAINNINLVLGFFKERGLLTKYKKELVCYKQYVRNQCIMLINDKKIRREWLSTFPELNIKVLFSTFFTLKYKIKYILAVSGIKTKNVSL